MSSLKYIKIFIGTPTCFDLKRSSSGSLLYLAKVTGLFKNLRSFKFLNTEFKIPTVNSGVVAAIYYM